MSDLEKLKEKISEEDLKTFYYKELLSIKDCAKKLHVSTSCIKILIQEYKLFRDNHLVRSKKNSEVKNEKYLKIKERISKDELENFYIIEDHGYYDALDHFKLTGWTFDRLLKDYGIKKDKKIACKKGLQTKYNRAGSKEEYFKIQQEKSKKTKIEKYGSLEDYKKYIAEKCHNAWMEVPEDVRKERAQISLSHGGGWNFSTIHNTLLEKYNVDNAYKLADHYQTNSKVNQLFADKLNAFNILYLREQLYNNMRYDFQVGNTLIELDPWPFHNTTWCPIAEASLIDKNYHKKKTENAIKAGFRCIHIFDWEDDDKVIDLIKPRETIYGRCCGIKEVSKEEAKLFINQYHLQGYARDSIRIGLYNNSELISIMTFGKPRYNKKYQYELIRYCSSKNILGGSAKLFNYFKNIYKPESIISYCDLSKFVGTIYEKLGFNLLNQSQPARHWYNIKTGQHITDNLLRQHGFDRLLGTQFGIFGKGTSNEELMRKHNFVEVYDCGQATYIWEKNK